MTTIDRVAAVPPRRGALGVLVSAGVTLLLTPVHAFLLAFVVLAAGTYDASGRGGPFRACTAGSVSCTGPRYGAIAVCAVVLVVLAWAAAVAGARTGRYRRGWRSWLLLVPLNVVVAAGGAIGFWWVQR
ncbi:hypothetical protein [Jiangella aurantiaca]|uniref:hypothetical protein n=1 Tax=Jiangella aurantiaca TaxID=2530373 RepID=UPI001EF00544|nr:hypothetical protein [Jiangella aurantiaca]